MRYIDVELISRVETGIKDELGNEIKADYSNGFYKARLSPWSSDDVELQGREVTQTSFKVLLYGYNRNIARKSDYIKIGGNRYEIESTKRMGRWILLVARGFYDGLEI